ncbi:MAG: DUF3048 domain-containing protein [Peptococcaceae bacterium]
MRKYVALFLVLILFVAFCGCSKNEAGAPAENEQQAEKELDAEEQEPAEQMVSLTPMIKSEKELPGSLIVSVDNHRNAYPQSGLDKADRVYEILAEGGITRYLAVFHSQKAEKIGPVRSARYYFAYLVKGHDAPFAHAGGNTDALNLIPRLKIKDLDEIYNSGAYFWRDKSRKMPHNLYTSTELLQKGAEKKKYALVPLNLLEQGEVAGEPADLIDITYSTDPRYLYTVTYEWDGGRYKRYINGVPHKSLEGAEIFTENVIVMEAETREVVKEELESEIDLLGQGKAYFFTGGKFVTGEWKKAKAEDELEFIYDGDSMKFQGEHAWINIVPSLNDVKRTKIP